VPLQPPPPSLKASELVVFYVNCGNLLEEPEGWVGIYYYCSCILPRINQFNLHKLVSPGLQIQMWKTFLSDKEREGRMLAHSTYFAR
jgi:hypothetical protein